MDTNVNIQWFPGHMTKAKRKIAEALPLIDIVIELIDARIPEASKNPDFETIFAGKPVITLMTKCSLADPAQTERYVSEASDLGRRIIPIDCKDKTGLGRIMPEIKLILADKLKKREQKGMKKNITAMVAGISNVGKSTFINTFSGTKKAKAEDRPGVTRSNQWISIPSKSIDLLDTPGVLWPKFDDKMTGLRLAFTGAIRDEILDSPEIAILLIADLRKNYSPFLESRYRIEISDGDSDFEVFEKIARKRGFIRAGAEIDDERCAHILTDEFQSGKIGRITLI